jgi:phospholipid/cholesterol/gamma-HCH transport system substrate-binding protein
MRSAEFRWSQVRVGLFVAIAGIILFAAIFYFGLIGSPLSNNATLYGQFDDMAGLGVGSPVEMSGVSVGQVLQVELPDLQTGKLPVTLTLDREALKRLGPSSEAFTSSHAVVGQRFIGLTLRKPNEPPLKDGDMIRARPGAGFESLAGEAGEAVRQLNKLLGQAQTIAGVMTRMAGSVENGDGTLGKLLHDDTLYTRLNETAKNARDFTTQASKGHGPLEMLISDRQLADHLRETAGALAATTKQVRDGKGLLGRLTYDADAATKFDQTLSNIEAVSTKLNEAQGALGALINDPVVLGRVNRLLGEVDSLVADVRRNPHRYLKIGPF